MYPVYSIPLFVTSVGVFSFGCLVLLRSPWKKLTQLFFLCALSVAWWSLGYGLMYSSKDASAALFFARMGYIGVVFIPTFFCHFVVEFLKGEKNYFLATCYVLSFVFLLISRSDLFLSGMNVYFWGYYPRAGPLYGLFILFFYWGFGTCVYFLLKLYMTLRKTMVPSVMLNQVKYVLLAFCVASASFSDYLPNYHIEVYPFAYLAATGWLVLMAYGTLKYRVMDINVIIRKTLVYSVVMVSLTALYLCIIGLFTKLFEGFTGYQTILSSTVAAGLITVCFQPLRKRVQSFVDAKFFRQYVDREEKLYELSREVITHTTPEAMAEALMRVIREALHPKSGVMFLRLRDGDEFFPMGAWGSDKIVRMPETNALAQYFIDHPQPFVQEQPSEAGTPQSTRTIFRRNRVIG